MKNKIEKIKVFLQNNPRKKIQLIFFLTFFFFILFIYFASANKVDKEENKNKYEDIKINTNNNDEEFFEEYFTDRTDSIEEDLKNKEEEIKILKEEILALQNNIGQLIISNTNNTNKDNNQNTNYPASPNQNDTTIQSDLMPTLIETQETELIGTIVHESFNFEEEEIITSEIERTFFMPPSFMSGYLLTGMDAMTTSNSSNNPEPMLIRVQAPAVLPNEVKANLQGCFVVAEGYGNLATHRVDARLVSLSCINKSNGYIIHEKIKGYVQDSDGKRGISGTVIHRAGSLIAKSMLIGGLEGAGEALSPTPQKTSQQLLNTLDPISTNTLESESTNNNIKTAIIGGAMKNASKDIKELFVELARQTVPVVEIKASKRISVIITDLVEIKLKKVNYE